jgi:hypothetical protein
VTATVVWLTNGVAIATYLTIAAALVAAMIASSRRPPSADVAGEPRPRPLARHAAGASPQRETPAPEATGTGAQHNR